MVVIMEPALPNSCSACGRRTDLYGNIGVRTGWRGWCCICNAEWHLQQAQVLKAKTECCLKGAGSGEYEAQSLHANPFLPGDKVFIFSYTWRQWFEATVVETIHYERVTVEFAPHPNMPHRKHVPWGSWSIIRKADNMDAKEVAVSLAKLNARGVPSFD